MTDTLDWDALLEQARGLTSYRELLPLVRRADARLRDQGPPPGARAQRVALLCGGAPQMLEGLLRLALLEVGVAAELHLTDFDRVVPELLDPDSATAAFRPDVGVVLNTPFNLPAWPALGDDVARANELAREAAEHWLDPAETFHATTGAELVITALPPLQVAPYGHLGAKLPADPNNFIRRVNGLLGDLAPDFVHVVDPRGSAATAIGELPPGAPIDLRYWYLARQPIAFEHLPTWARAVARVIAARLGTRHKCLVLDLDNTLWGGVIGDDGLQGLTLGEGDPVGEAFKAFQRHLKALRERGVLLAVSSKNEEATARRVFEEHPDCVLKLDDFVAFRANWEPKSANLASIAAELNLGTDALVFLDDNPVERAEVRSAGLNVTVPELPDEPALFPSFLDGLGYFETTALSTEDLERTGAYRARRKATELRARTTDKRSYLQSLEMRAEVRPFRPVDLERIVQLTNKTNQFNLTTRRTTATEVQFLMDDPGAIARTVRLSDRFGDHGLIAIAVGRIEGDRLEIIQWLMSCRVIDRGVEMLLLNELSAAAAARGLREILGTYVPTERNRPVAGHYERLGFEPALAQPAQPGQPGQPAQPEQQSAQPGSTRWRLDIRDHLPRAVPIQLEPAPTATPSATTSKP